MGLPPKGYTPLLEDNEGTIILSERGLGESRTKHIDVRFHMLEKLVKNGTVKLFRVPTDENLADIFTKINFTYEKFNYLADRISVKLGKGFIATFGMEIPLIGVSSEGKSR